MKKSSCWFATLALLAACAGGDPTRWAPAGEEADDSLELELDEGDAQWGSVEQPLCADTSGVAGFPGNPLPCDDVGIVTIIEVFDDDRRELGTFTGNGRCIAFEHPDFRGNSLALDKNFIFTFVGSKMNDRISSFRVASGCRVIGFRDPDQRGARTIFRSDNAFVGHDQDDAISSFECSCR